MSDVFNRNLCSSPALHQQRLREVFQTSTADWVQFISASLLISDKIKRVESVIPTVANKRNYLRPTVNTYLCSKTVACKKSIMSQLCPKLRPLFFQKSSGRSSETPSIVCPKIPAAVHPKLWPAFKRNSGSSSEHLAVICLKLGPPNYGDSSLKTPAAVNPKLLLTVHPNLRPTIYPKLWPRLSLTSAVHPKLWLPFVRNIHWWFIQNSDCRSTKIPVAVPLKLW